MAPFALLSRHAAGRSAGARGIGHLASAFAGCSVFAARIATAEPPPTASAPLPAAVQVESHDIRGEAERRFQRGLALAHAQRWDAALDEFVASRALYPTRSATRNAAIALQKLKRHSEAYEMYALLQQQFRATSSAEQWQTTQLEMDTLKASLGELRLQVSQAGAAIVVDGRPRGTTPVSAPILLDPGTHTLELLLSGFEPHVVRFSVAAGQLADVQPILRPVTAGGSLSVAEARGGDFEVVIDSTVVGRTPWRGRLSPGVHSIQLRGAQKWGTAPRSTVIELGKETRLTLQALPLDATLEVIPKPTRASVFIDGVFVGTGPWRGALPDGAYRVEVVDVARAPFHTEVRLHAGKLLPVVAELQVADAEPANPSRAARLLSGMYGELTGGALLARSLEGGADDACNCAQRSRPLGAAGTLRLGYSLDHEWGIELSAGYLVVSESMSRRMTAQGERYSRAFRSLDVRDSTRLSGAAFLASVSHRTRSRFPLTTRIAAGLAPLVSETESAGTFIGELVNPVDPADVRSKAVPLSWLDQDQRLLVGVVASELSLGYRISERWSVDLGLGVWLFVPPRRVRTVDGRSRSARLPDEAQPWAPGQPVRPGSLTLPNELVAGPFLALKPELGVHVDF